MIVVFDQDVGGLEVAVHDADFVCGAEPGRYLAGERQGSRDGELSGACEEHRQILALDVRHRDIADALGLADVMNPHDVLMRDLAREQELLPETLLCISHIASFEWPKDFQRDGETQRAIPRLGDVAAPRSRASR